MLAKKIIFYNQKGGVGKTTATLNLGSALAELGYKVLIIDFDAQRNLTAAISGNTNLPNIYEALIGKVDIKNTIQPTLIRQLYLIPGSIDLAGLSMELVDENKREFFLKKALEQVEGEFEYILVDCPPSLGLETMNALVWCEYVIVPLQCEYLAMEGLNLIMRTISNVKKKLNKEIKVLGILFTMYSKRAKLNQEVVEDISEFFPDLVFKTIIPRSIRLAEAPSHGLPINYYDKSNKGTRAFDELAKEVVNRV